MLEFRPAIIASSNEELSRCLSIVKPHVDVIRLDIMDGKFVPGRTLEPGEMDLAGGVRYEAHLMVTDPAAFLADLAGRGVELAIFHLKIDKDISEIIGLVKDLGMRVGLALSPSAQLEDFKEFFTKADVAHVMTVDPGKWGAPFLPENLQKIPDIKKINPKIRISVDGHMNPDTLPVAIKAGGEVFSVGSFIFRSKKPEEAIRQIKDVLRKFDS